MTLLHYPASELAGFDQASAPGIHPHKDTDLLTILAPDPVGGLFIQTRNSSKWLEIRCPNDALIVNVGDMLETWSSGYFVSTPHKVVHQGAKARISFPFFVVPNYKCEIKPLGLKNNSRAHYATAGEISEKVWLSNWPDAEAIEACYDPYIHS